MMTVEMKDFTLWLGRRQKDKERLIGSKIRICRAKLRILKLNSSNNLKNYRKKEQRLSLNNFMLQWMNFTMRITKAMNHLPRDSFNKKIQHLTTSRWSLKNFRIKLSMVLHTPQHLGRPVSLNLMEELSIMI